MKNILLRGLVITLALSVGTVAFAQTGVNASVNASVNLRASTTKPGILQQVKNEIKDNVKDVVKRRTEHRYTRMLARFQATIERQESITLRINSRITKVKANGGNTTEAEKFVAEAKIHTDAAKASLVTLTAQAEAQAEIENASTTAKALRDGLTAMRKTGAEIQKHLREAHASLIKAIVSLARLSGIKLQATTTATVN